MRLRHRIPSVFSLSMVDVFCCAMGAVVLLWLISLYKGKEKETLAEAERVHNVQLNTQLEEFLEKNKDLLAAQKDLQTQLSKREVKLNELLAALQTAEGKIKGLDERLVKLLKENTTLTSSKETLEEQLKKKDVKLDDVLAALKKAQEKSLTLDFELKKYLEKNKDLTVTKEDLETQLKKKDLRLDDVLAALKAAENKSLTLDAELRKYLDKNKDLLARKDDLDRQLAKNDVKLKEVLTLLAKAEERAGKAEGDRTQVEREFSAFRKAADNRFAGIDLGGDIRRVVFLVDMSGSMVLVENERDYKPEKWTAVRDTVVKIMESLPRLDKYQLIVFSDEHRFLLGNPGNWLDFDRTETPTKVQEALTKLKPVGGTNMYDAFEAAFKFRKDKLDTVFFLSDGLPNLPLTGAGLGPGDVGLTELQRGEKLGKYIRKKLKEEWNPTPRVGSRIRINTIGFYYESPDLGAFLWALARENEGSFVGMSKP